jgi:hypothetical protein
VRQRWAGLATTIAVVSSLLALNGAIESAKADNSSGQTWTLFAAGDVASPLSGADELNAVIVKNGVAADPDHTRVAMLGDGAYPDGSIDTYNREYGKAGSWGDFKDKTYPVPGNHDYGRQMSASDAGYRMYWDSTLQALNGDHGETSGDTLKDQSGWYSVDVGPYWHLIALNWACSNGPNTSGGAMSGCSETDPQGVWLAGDLQKATAAHKHIIAMWHGARFFSKNDNATPTNPADDPGPSTDAPKTNAYWKMLQGAGADFVLAGHHHNYEVFQHMSVVEPGTAPAGDHQGQVDPTGPREFVVGTGGGEQSHFVTSVPPAVGSDPQHPRRDGQWGVLKLTLEPNSYQWDFLSSGSPNEAAAGTVLDHGAENTLSTVPVTATTDTTVTTGPGGPEQPQRLLDGRLRREGLRLRHRPALRRRRAHAGFQRRRPRAHPER